MFTQFLPPVLAAMAQNNSWPRHDQCPKCQALNKVPESGDLKDLPTSFYLNGLINVLAIKECNNSQVQCGNCDKKSSETSYCFQCCIFYCQQCVIGHNIMRSNKDHRVLALKDFQEKDFDVCDETTHVLLETAAREGRTEVLLQGLY